MKQTNEPKNRHEPTPKVPERRQEIFIGHFLSKFESNEQTPIRERLSISDKSDNERK